MLSATALLGCSSAATRTSAPTPVVADNTLTQSGKVVVSAHAFQDVYFPAAYAGNPGNPTLEVPTHWGDCKVISQSPTHFRVLNTSGSDLVVDWKATGLKAPPTAVTSLGAPQRIPPVVTRPVAQPAIAPVSATAPATPPAQPAAPGLPPEPVPVVGSR